MKAKATSYSFVMNAKASSYPSIMNVKASGYPSVMNAKGSGYPAVMNAELGSPTTVTNATARGHTVVMNAKASSHTAVMNATASSCMLSLSAGKLMAGCLRPAMSPALLRIWTLFRPRTTSSTPWSIGLSPLSVVHSPFCCDGPQPSPPLTGIPAADREGSHIFLELGHD